MVDLTQRIRDIVATTVGAVDPERIILFGSYARGDAGPDSDVDLLVVAGRPLTPACRRQDELKRIRRALRGVRMPVDLLLYTPEEIDAWRDSPNHIIGRSLREGITVYARS